MNTHALKLGTRIAALCLLAGLGACASAADPGAMTVSAPAATATAGTAPAAAPAFPGKLQHAMCVHSVTGGEETNPMWVSKVDDNGFKTALTGSLDNAGLTAPSGSCTYQIDVNLLGLSQPSLGLDMTVTSHVNYKVLDQSGQPYLLATIDAPYTATVGDAFIGVERLKLANEGAIRTSIQMFFDKLRAQQ